MFDFIKDFEKLYLGSKGNGKQDNKKSDEKHFISKNLKENLSFFKEKFSGSSDLTIREMEIANLPGAVITIEGMIDKRILATSVINPIVGAKFNEKDGPKERYEKIKNDIVASSEQVQVESFEDAFNFIMSGFVLIAIDGCEQMLAIGIQGFSFRGISEPTSEVMQRGSREGFVEPMRINMTLIRRRIKNPSLKFETGKIGTLSKTDICLCYLTDKVSPELLEQVKDKLNRVDLESVLASGYVTPYLEEENDLSLFSSVGISERPDTICGKLLEGRIAILIDGTPNAIVVPYLFIEYFQHLDDYAIRPYFATLTRWLKYIAFFVATLIPGLYVGISTFNPEFLPNALLAKIAVAVGTTPFPLMVETLLIHFMYELMREAGLRLPKPLGHAVSIVGALVIGETAVSAGLVGSPTLMVVALTALASYVIPNLYEPIALLRLVFILAGGIMGIWGIMLLFAIVLVDLCAKSNFGIPFMAPISPFGMFGMRDVIVRASWKVLSKKDNKVQKMPGSEI